MMLIDADALIHELNEIVRHSTGEFQYGVKAACIAVMEAPTIGGWIATWDNKRKKYVTHWLPMPKLPKEVSEDVETQAVRVGVHAKGKEHDKD